MRRLILQFLHLTICSLSVSLKYNVLFYPRGNRWFQVWVRFCKRACCFNYSWLGPVIDCLKRNHRSATLKSISFVDRLFLFATLIIVGWQRCVLPQALLLLGRLNFVRWLWYLQIFLYHHGVILVIFLSSWILKGGRFRHFLFGCYYFYRFDWIECFFAWNFLDSDQSLSVLLLYEVRSVISSMQFFLFAIRLNFLSMFSSWQALAFVKWLLNMLRFRQTLIFNGLFRQEEVVLDRAWIWCPQNCLDGGVVLCLIQGWEATFVSCPTIFRRLLGSIV